MQRRLEQNRREDSGSCAQANGIGGIGPLPCLWSLPDINIQKSRSAYCWLGAFASRLLQSFYGLQ